MLIQVCNCNTQPKPQGVWPNNASLAIPTNISPDGSHTFGVGNTVSIRAERYWCEGCKTYFAIVPNKVPFRHAYPWPEVTAPCP